MSGARSEIVWLADTSLLICFGALPKGASHLATAYGKKVAVTPTVRWELTRIMTAEPRSARGIAAGIFAGRNASKVGVAIFQRRDEPERATALAHLAANTVPSTPPARLDSSPDGENPSEDVPCKKKHAGEAETVAVATRTRQPLLMTDAGGVRYATSRGLLVESFTDGMSRLVGTVPQREIYKMWLEVSRQHYPGPEVVRGQNDFRIPTRSA